MTGNIMNIEEEIQKLLSEIGPGRMSSTAYDTAWIARLGEMDWTLSSQALNWLSEHQLSDGSWGAEKPFYYHDRVISTLSAMIALTYRGRRTQDRMQIEKGLLALEQITSGATQGLQADPNGATIGFEMIVPTLVEEAEKLGIIKQQGERILGRLSELRKIKLKKMMGYRINRHVTMAFSAEMAGLDGQNMLDIDNIQEENGSVGHSPSATAFFVRHVRPGDARGLEYLRGVVSPDGSFPNLFPFEVYERAWVLWNLSLIDSLDTTITDLFQPHLDFLQSSWHSQKGIGLSIGFSVPDGDNTSVVFDLLTQHNREVDINGLLAFDEQDHFRCYELEANSSVSVNIHALAALKRAGYDINHPIVKKVLTFLRKGQTSQGFWFDKWHISPYYTTSHAIITCTGYFDELVEPAVQWIISSQQENGSWGSYLQTVEETAYCLQALCHYQKRGGSLPPGIIKKGANWLKLNLNPPYPLFWIGKGLYAGELVIRSAIISALALIDGR
jgi:halimadienyl-diphosphate synthase